MSTDDKAADEAKAAQAKDVGKIPPKPTTTAASEGENSKPEIHAAQPAPEPAASAPSFTFTPEGEGSGDEQGAGAQTDEVVTPAVAQDLEGDRWTDDLGPRGRVISLTRGDGPSTTFEEVVALHEADDPAKIAAAKARLRSRFGG